ncbi:flagellar biosynthesis anti-sigma factor FlgM [Vibrio sp.]|uniref:flagellar biosynthesis anti-sigma factor FlgM n=1 Tax=Vibrio sp. TaxID=678 RepID=UPI003D0A24C7
MKIDKVAGGHVPHTQLKQTRSQTQSQPSVAGSSETQINANTSAIDRAQAQLAQMADVDMAKVEQVRNALAKGEIRLDSHSLSQAVMQFHTGHES